jgi:hypothetical protein
MFGGGSDELGTHGKGIAELQMSLELMAMAL